MEAKFNHLSSISPQKDKRNLITDILNRHKHTQRNAEEGMVKWKQTRNENGRKHKFETIMSLLKRNTSQLPQLVRWLVMEN